MFPWRGITLKLISSYKNRDICQVNDFLPFFLSKLWPDLSRKCYIFCMKDFVSVLFLFTGPSREQWLQFKTKNIWCHLEISLGVSWWPQLRCTQNLKFTDLCNSGDTMKIFRKLSLRPCNTKFSKVLPSPRKLPL